MRTVEVPSEGLGGQAQKATDRAIRDVGPWMEGLGRFGYIAIGLVYATIGVLAALAGLGQGGGTTDSHGALGWIVQAPFGRGILVALAVGVVGYAMWRFVQAIRDTESKGTDLKGIYIRLVYAFIGIVYAGLALSAIRLAQGQGERGAGGDAAAQDWTAWLLSQPFGQVLVVAVGLGVLVAGLVQLYIAFADTFLDSMHLSDLGEAQQRLIAWAGRIGYSARGIAFGIIGVLLTVAALHQRPEEARGLGGALAMLAEQPFGPWLLAAVGSGFVAYGAFKVVQARYHRFDMR